jgi:hypothetical protein
MRHCGSMGIAAAMSPDSAFRCIANMADLGAGLIRSANDPQRTSAHAMRMFLAKDTVRSHGRVGIGLF